MNSRLPRFLPALVVFLAGLVSATAQISPGTAEVKYYPGLTRVEGDQPLTMTVTVAITSPSNVPVGSTVVITPLLSMLGQPAGVPNSVALSYVTFNPSSLTFTGPNQTVSARIDLAFPAGVTAGLYQYKFIMPGWLPGTQDLGGFLNATIRPQPVPSGPPTITITTPVNNPQFTYFPLVGPLSVPISFKSSAPTSTPITSIDADVDGTFLTLANVTNADGSITSTSNVSITTPGLHTLRARATNNNSTVSAASDFTVVVSAPPPTVTIAQPTGPSYTMATGSTLRLPYSFKAVSNYGGITGLTATLNGTAVTFTPAGLGTLTATGSGEFLITAGGTYNLDVTGVDSNGTAHATQSFTVVAATPAPTIAISQPANGSTFTRVAGSPATSIPFTFTAQASSGFVIDSVAATLGGTPVTFTTAGLNTATTTGTGALAISAPGTYTLTANCSSSGVVASASTTFTVTETTPPPPSTCAVLWLPPISLNKLREGGSVLPIKFRICCAQHQPCGDHGDDHSENDHCDDHSENDHGDSDHSDSDHADSSDCSNGERYGWGRTSDDEIHAHCKGDRDTSIVIAIFEIRSDGTTSAPTLFPYDRFSPNPPTYTIQGNNMYHLNFPVPDGKHTYRVEIYRPLTSYPTPQLLGFKEFTTK